MSTPYEVKSTILGTFWKENYAGELPKKPEWLNMFNYKTIGLPLAFVELKGVSGPLKPEHRKLVEDTWVDFCRVKGVDPEGEYASLQEVDEQQEDPFA